MCSQWHLKKAVITPFNFKVCTNAVPTLKCSANILVLYRPSHTNTRLLFSLLRRPSNSNRRTKRHIEHFRILPTSLQGNHIVVYYPKCLFCVSELTFFDHYIGGNSVKPLPQKIEAIFHFPNPSNIIQLLESLWLINFFCRRLRNSAYYYSRNQNTRTLAEKNF